MNVRDSRFMRAVDWLLASAAYFLILFGVLGFGVAAGFATRVWWGMRRTK